MSLRLVRRAALSAVLVLALSASEPIPLDGVIRPSSGAAAGSEYAYIPPPSGGNHAASIIFLPDGTLLCAWFSGGEGQPNCAIALSRLPPGATAWTAGAVVALVPEQSSQNPVLFYDALTREVLLWHTTQSPSAGESSSFIWRTTSRDGGLTWAPTAPFFAVAGAFTRNAALALPPDGHLLLPIYNSTPGAIPDYPIVLLSDATHALWTPHRAPGADLIQPSVMRLPDGTLRAWLRDENQSCAYAMDSADSGVSWTSPAATAIPNNNAALAVLRLQSGAIALAYDAQRGPSTPRSPLVISLSADDGATWPVTRTLMTHDDNSSSVGEISYPALTQTADGLIHAAFTVDRIAIKYMRFSERWLRAGGN